MKRLSFVCLLSLLFITNLSAQNEVILGSDEYNSLKESGDLFNDNYQIIDPTNPNLSMHSEVYPAGHGTEGRDIGCGCWVQPDGTYSQAGFPTNPAVDDGSTLPISIPFDFCLYGTTYTNFFINTNGNISFGNGFGTFTPTGFPMGTAMIAPFWADVDPSCGPPCGTIWYKVTEDAIFVNWLDVAYYNENTDKLNRFQTIITNGMNDFVGQERNVAFCYEDMQWTTGDASQGNNGFGGTPATVGANAGNNSDFIQFGRFSQNNSNYDGPFGAEDGVNWLDNQTIVFNACAQDNDNIPPIASGNQICDTAEYCLNETAFIELQFLSPELGQTVSLEFDPGDLVFDSFEIIEGNTTTFTGTLTADSDNLGLNTITFTATDDGVPAGVTVVEIVISIQDVEVPDLDILGEFEFCSGGATTLTASPGFDDYFWNAPGNCIGPECSFDATVEGATVTAVLAGCTVESPPFDITEQDFFLPCISPYEEPICSNDSTLVQVCPGEVDDYVTFEWAVWQNYPGTIYGPTDGPSIYCSSGTFVLWVTTPGGCIGQRVFAIDATDATIPEDEWSGTFCDGPVAQEFSGAYATSVLGTFWLYMFNTDDNWFGDNASLDLYVNGELIHDDIQALFSGQTLVTASAEIGFGDFIEIFYDPGNSTGTESVDILNCDNNFIDVEPLVPGLVWSGFANCESDPAFGEWTVVNGPDGSTFTETEEYNSTWTPSEYGAYTLNFYSATCGIDYTYDIIFSEAPAVSIPEDEYLLCDQGVLTIEPDITDPYDDVTIEWTGGSSEETLDVSASGEYCISVINGCGTFSDCADVIIEPIPDVIPNQTFDLCDGETLTLDPVSEDHPSFQYLWEGPGGFFETGDVETLTETGLYNITVSNNCGTDETEIILNIENALVVNVNDEFLCDEANATLVANTSSANVTYSWDTGENTQSIEVDESGQFCVVVTSVCETVTECGDVTIQFTPSAGVSPTEVLLCPGVEQIFQANSTVENVSYSWIQNCGGSSTAVGGNNPFLSVIPEDIPEQCLVSGATYVLTVSNDCGSSNSSFIVMLDPCLLDIPNVISPNGDNQNDVFVINGIENYIALGGVNLLIFNRWGNLVLEENDYRNDWGAKDVEDGTYYYILTLPGDLQLTGNITVIKN